MAYTYRLTKSPTGETGEKTVYRLQQLQSMSAWQLKEICQRERLAVPMGTRLDREEMIRFIMRYRGMKDYRHITEDVPGGLNAVQNFLRKVDLKEDRTAQVFFPSNLVLYEGEGIALTDRLRAGGDGLYEGNILLVDEEYTVYTCLYLKEVPGMGFSLLKGKEVPVKKGERHQYFLLYFLRPEVSEILYDIYSGNDVSIPRQAAFCAEPLLSVEIRKTEETDMPLVIDFGSANTTLGTYCADGSTQVVRVADTGDGSYRESSMIPSLVGIKGLKGGSPEYVFGYEARQLAQNAGPDGDWPVFYDIKRWVSAPDRAQQVVTVEGVRISARRCDMLEAYMRYLIGTAQQQFKCRFRRIQLLVPVRQKSRFEALFGSLLPEYEVSCSLDEGMAVLFYSIQELISAGRYEDGVSYRALVMDCGGGTTDLTAGRFCIRDTRVSYEVSLQTGYENGDTNFGGNNLTYRLVQLLKLRLAEAMGHKEFAFAMSCALDSRTKTEHGLYERLESLYREVENVMPTRFADYENRGREEYFRVKSNYYQLFLLAESVKERFFSGTFKYVLPIGAGIMEEDGAFVDKWKLSVWENGQLCPLKKGISFRLYLYEVENLLRPDIFSLMGRFLEQPFARGSLSDYNMLKLTGQSCKSGLFLEALKEYVPGRLIKTSGEGSLEGGLKMCCLEGAVSYLKNRRLGYMKIDRGSQDNALPYEVRAFTHENKEKVLVHSLKKGQDIGYISRFKAGGQMDFYLHDEKGRKLKACHFPYDVTAFSPVTQEEIDEKYAGTVIQEQTDTIIEGETKFFVWPARDKWGFVTLPVLRENGLLRKGEEAFFAFEDDTWEENFFDGRK